MTRPQLLPVNKEEVVDEAKPGPIGGSGCMGKSPGPARSPFTQVVRGDAARMPIRAGSAACIVTSPPYNLGVAYDGYRDRVSWPGYWDLVHRSCREMARMLVDGGRVWVNVMRTEPEHVARDSRGGRSGHTAPRIDLARVWGEGLEQAGLAYRETVVWAQDAWDGGCSWGSWRMPSAPNLRGQYEVVLVYHKGPWKRKAPAGLEAWRDELPGWEDCSRNVWRIPPTRSSEHPAVFPDELARRCIRLSTWPGELVVDCFCGAGTTIRAARDLGRRGLGVELSRAYVRLSADATAQGVLC